MSAVGAARRQGRDHLGGPYLIKYGQDLPDAQWYVNNAATVRARPWDGTMVLLPISSNDAMSITPLALSTVQSEVAGFGTADFGDMVHNFLMIRTTFPPEDLFDWWNDSQWEIITQNWKNVAQVAASLPNVDGIIYDNEWYGYDAQTYTGPYPFDWGGGYPEDAGGPYGDSGQRNPAVAPGIGIDPTHTLAQSRAKVYQRGKDIMDAMRTVFPDIRVGHLHGPYTSAHETGVRFPWFNSVAYANELTGSFFAGMVESAGAGPALMLDSGETYMDTTVLRWQEWHDWVTRGFPASTTTVIPSSLKPTYRASCMIGLFDYGPDDNGNYDNWGGEPQLRSPTTVERMISRSMFACETYVWFYSEYHQWWGVGNPSIDPTVTQAMLDAVASGRLRGKRRHPV